MTGMVWPVSSEKWKAPLASMELRVGKKNLQMTKSLLHVKQICPQALYQKLQTKRMNFEKVLG